MLKGLTWAPRPLQGLLLTSTPRRLSLAKAKVLLKRLPGEATSALPPLHRFKFLFKWGLHFYYAATTLLAWHVAIRALAIAAALADVPLALAKVEPAPLHPWPAAAGISLLHQLVVFAPEASINTPKRFALGWWTTAVADFNAYAPLRQQKLYRFSPRMALLAGLSVRLFN